MNGLLVKDGVLSRVEVTREGPNSIRELVGAGIGRCFTIWTGEHTRITGWADDDYFYKDTPWNVGMADSVYPGGWPVRGNIVILGLNGPESVGLTEPEMAMFRITSEQAFPFNGTTLMLPRLTYDVG